MPIIEAHILEGYEPAAKARPHSALTNAVRVCVAAPEEGITVLLHEYASDNYSRGGRSRTPGPANPDPVEIALSFLRFLEARDLVAVSALLDPGFKMVFPGTEPMETLDQLIAWAKGRYRFVKKTIEATEAFPVKEGSVVYIRGTLYGEWPDGEAFSGIRFVDRLEIAGGKILKQDVWNDIAEVRSA